MVKHWLEENKEVTEMDKKVSETKPDFSTQASIVWRNVIVSYAWGSLFINHLQVSHEMRREKSRRLEMNRKPWKRAQQIGQLLKKDFTSNFLRSDLREINLVRLTQCGNFAIFVPLWFHVKYEWQKNFKFSHYYCDLGPRKLAFSRKIWIKAVCLQFQSITNLCEKKESVAS